jgi:hypothetical protein
MFSGSSAALSLGLARHLNAVGPKWFPNFIQKKDR